MTSRESTIFRLFSARTGTDFEPAAELPMLVTPGDVITNDTDYMRLKIKCISLNYWPCIHVGKVTGQLADKPTRRQSNNSPTVQLADKSNCRN